MLFFRISCLSNESYKAVRRVKGYIWAILNEFGYCIIFIFKELPVLLRHFFKKGGIKVIKNI